MCYRHYLFYVCFYYPNARRRVNITRYLYSRGRPDRFSRNAQAKNWIEVTKKMANNLNYLSEDEESE